VLNEGYGSAFVSLSAFIYTPPPRVATVSNAAVQHGPIALPKNMCGAYRHFSHIFYVRTMGQLTRS
jgi:hypothetical protein